MDDFILVLIIIISLVIIFYCLFHLDCTLRELFQHIRQDIMKCFQYFHPKPRYIFPDILYGDFRKIIAPFANPAFDVEIFTGFDFNLPVINILFVPLTTLNPNEVQRIGNLILLKFRKFLRSFNLPWKTFVTYATGENEVKISLFYAELLEDNANFDTLLGSLKRAQQQDNVGEFVDEDLEREMNDENSNWS